MRGFRAFCVFRHDLSRKHLNAKGHYAIEPQWEQHIYLVPPGRISMTPATTTKHARYVREVFADEGAECGQVEAKALVARYAFALQPGGLRFEEWYCLIVVSELDGIEAWSDLAGLQGT